MEGAKVQEMRPRQSVGEMQDFRDRGVLELCLYWSWLCSNIIEYAGGEYP